jgi:hypothetical protein
MDRMLRPAEQGERPADAIWNTPGIGTFFQRTDGAGKILEFYELDSKVDEVVASLNRAKASGNAKRMQEIAERDRGYLAAKPATDTIGNKLRDIRRIRMQISNAPKEAMTAEQKRLALDQFRRIEIDLSKQIAPVKKMAKELQQ